MASPAEKAAVSEILKASNNPVIVDLGSYDGADADWMLGAAQNNQHRDAFPHPARCVVVEPDLRNVKLIVDQRAHKWSAAYVSIRAMAIADHSGICEFYPCEHSLQQGPASGSIRRPTGHLKHFEWCKFRLPIAVACISLDDLYRHEFLDHVDVLWVDIQGAERDMIAGGREALKRTRYMFIEAESTELYDGQALKPELLSLFADWEVVETFDYNLLLKNKAYTQ